MSLNKNEILATPVGTTENVNEVHAESQNSNVTAHVSQMIGGSSENAAGASNRITEEAQPWKFLVDKRTGKYVTIHCKPVILWKGQTVLNMNSGFEHKLLCTGPTFNLGDACGYSCPFCYVEAATHGRFNAFLEKEGLKFQDVIIRRENALVILKRQLERLSIKKREFPHEVFSSTTVDIAANVELVKETAEACVLIFKMTKWKIRLLSKSNMLLLLVNLIPEEYRQRLILGVSTGTFDDDLAQAVETGTPLVSKRIESLHKLQDAGLRTYAMVCPSMPMKSVEEYELFAQKSSELLRYDLMEHVWAEAMNVRGDNFTRMIASLDAAGQIETRNLLVTVCGDGDGARERWEEYCRATFEAHKKVVPAGKLRFLQYVDRDKDLPYWKEQEAYGAVILGTADKRAAKKAAEREVMTTMAPTGDEERIRGLLAANLSIERKRNKLDDKWFQNGVIIGQHFARVKAEHPRQYISYLTTHFKVNRRTANNLVVVYEEQDGIRAQVQLGNVSHTTGAYRLARKLKREKKRLADLANKTIDVETEVVHSQPQLLLMDKTVEVPDDMAEDGHAMPVVAGFDIVNETELPVLVMRATEEVIAASLKAATSLDIKIEYQIIRPDGQIKLNQYFAKRLALAAA